MAEDIRYNLAGDTLDSLVLTGFDGMRYESFLGDTAIKSIQFAEVRIPCKVLVQYDPDWDFFQAELEK